MAAVEHVRTTKELVRYLLTEALVHLEVGMGEAAIWRIVDAAGLLGELSQTALGIHDSTGMGFRVVSEREQERRRRANGHDTEEVR